MHRLGAALFAGFLLLSPLTAAARANLAWEQWLHVPGVFDVVGPWGGTLLLATEKGLYQVDTATGELFPARVSLPIPAVGSEAYIALSPGLPVTGTRCSFPSPALYLLKTAAPPTVLLVDLVSGASRTFVPVPGVDTLSGIAFDRFGRFGNRLLVIGPHAGRTVVDAIDCNGKVSTVTDSAPTMEGGMEVAPPSFGAYGGDLIVPDEYSGDIIAVTPEGTTQVVARNGLATGTDIGAESAGFVPAGFLKGGAAYVADRATANNAHAGTDTILRLTSAQLQAEGVTEGDLLVASEGGGGTVVVHCAPDGSCSNVRSLGQATSAAHIEGHLLAVADNPGSAPPPLPPGKLGSAAQGGLFTYLPYGVGLIIFAAIYLYSRRRRPSRIRLP